MSVHHHLAYETVGYALDYVTLGSLVNSVKGGSYTLSILVANPFDLSLSRWTKQSDQRRLPGLGMRLAMEPAHETNDIDGRSCRHMLQMRALLTNIARPA